MAGFGEEPGADDPNRTGPADGKERQDQRCGDEAEPHKKPAAAYPVGHDSGHWSRQGRSVDAHRHEGSLAAAAGEGLQPDARRQGQGVVADLRHSQAGQVQPPVTALRTDSVFDATKGNRRIPLFGVIFTAVTKWTDSSFRHAASLSVDNCYCNSNTEFTTVNTASIRRETLLAIPSWNLSTAWIDLAER